MKMLIIILGLCSLTSANADTAPNAVQNNKGYTAVLKYLLKKKINPNAIENSDYHFYDGSLSVIEYKVDFFRGDETCELLVRVNYPYPDKKKSIAVVDEDATEVAECSR